jgi:outer membrane protein assembly factor BamB
VKNPRLLAVGPLLLAFALFATACVGVRNPEGWATPTVDDNTVYYFGRKDRLTAIDIAAARDPGVVPGTAPLLWRFPSAEQARSDDYKLRAAYTAPVRDGDHFYFASYEGELYRVRVDSGAGERIATPADVRGKVVGGPILVDGYLVFGTTEARLYAINKDDGSIAPGWPDSGIRNFRKGIWASPIQFGDFVIVADMSGDVTSIRFADGARTWTFSASGAVADIALLDDVLFVPSLDRHVYIVDPATGAQRGERFRAEDWVWTSPAYADGVAYFGDFSGNVYALDIRSMQLRWGPYEAGAKVKAAPALIQDVLIVADHHTVHFINARDGAGLQAVGLGDTGTVRAGVAVADGQAYIATVSGHLFRADPVRRTVVQIPLGDGVR